MPFEAVICDAASLTEAYRQQRDAMTRPTAEQHTRLANWCMQQQLFEEAERELQSALKLQPQHLPAHRLIEQLKGRKPRDSDFINKEQQQQMDDLLIKMEFSPGRPLGGLDASLAKDFATRIEPLLLNSCANASCHGQTAENSFRLTPKWNLRGNTRHITDQNLAAVLQQLDLKNPERSPLIAKLDGQHGPRRMPVFTGARAAEHRKNLENWALLAARYLATQSPRLLPHRLPANIPFSRPGSPPNELSQCLFPPTDSQPTPLPFPVYCRYRATKRTFLSRKTWWKRVAVRTRPTPSIPRVSISASTVASSSATGNSLIPPQPGGRGGRAPRIRDILSHIPAGNL
ncbi:MAG: hypothetical protein R3C12_18040 [Planctomycetaceae bacterium]